MSGPKTHDSAPHRDVSRARANKRSKTVMGAILPIKGFRFIPYCPHISQTFRRMGEKMIRTTAGKMNATSGKRSFTAAFLAAAPGKGLLPAALPGGQD